MAKTYWASLPSEDIGSEIIKRVEKYQNYLENSGILGELKKSYSTYYGNNKIETIDQSLQAIHINHYENLIRHVLVDVTSQRPAWEARAANTDSESMASTQLANGLLDYYMREKHIEEHLNSSIETSLFLREGWVQVNWDVNGGEIHGEDPDSGQVIREGDIEVKTFTILDVARDVKRRDMKNNWYVVTEYKNKWDLAAEKPELADKILSLKADEKDQYRFSIVAQSTKDLENDLDDLIPVYTLFHEKTPSVPSGRMVSVLSSDITLFDGALPFKRVYLFPVSPAKKVKDNFGHSNLLSLLPAQDAFNATVSAILSNQAANAVQNFQVPKGAAPNVIAVKDGLNIWEYDPKAGKMEPMDLLRTAPEVFNFAEFLMKQKELLSGTSQIARGNAPATMSGTAMALLAQQSIQFSSGVQLSRTILQEDVGTAIIELLQTFAVEPRVAQIVGKSKRPMLKVFKGEDLKGISRVFCDTANPLTKTSAGRVEIANQLLGSGLIKRPEQYLSVIATGQLEPIYEHEQAQLNLIRTENESLMEGESVNAVITDDDALHVIEHSSVFNSPEARQRPEILQAAFAHIQQHIEQSKAKDPILAAMLKQQSFFQSPQPQPMQQGMPGGDGPAPIMDNQNPITQQAEQTSLPKPAQPPEIGGM